MPGMVTKSERAWRKENNNQKGLFDGYLHEHSRIKLCDDPADAHEIGETSGSAELRGVT